MSLRSRARGRHESVRHIAQFFDYDHLPEDLQDVSMPFEAMAASLVNTLPDSPELVAGLRKLLEAKDCFVRAAVAMRPPRDAEQMPVERCPRRGGHPGHPWHEGSLDGGLYQIPPPHNPNPRKLWCRGEPG